MEFAYNYSPALAELVRQGLVQVDRFKCPAWPDLLNAVSREWPVYVHFPLVVGHGQGCAIDEERKQPADLERIADLMALTGTPQVNTHLFFRGPDYADIPVNSREPKHMQRVISAALRDLEPLVKRFGAQHVMVENIINEWGWLDLSVLPEVINRVLYETGCGFLFDLSHARLVAGNLGLDVHAYANSLPVERIREIHVTGIQMMAGELYDTLVEAGDPGGFAATFAGKQMDHLPMMDEDWPELDWVVGQIRAGVWRQPWVIASEIGGMGGFWEMVSTREMYLEQVPRMAAMIKGS